MVRNGAVDEAHVHVLLCLAVKDGCFGMTACYRGREPISANSDIIGKKLKGGESKRVDVERLTSG